jgi:pilus assembly protein FimV
VAEVRVSVDWRTVEAAGGVSRSAVCSIFIVSDSSNMALGFGFNKEKILSAAEKFVQQGKLPNAIAEYEKVLKQDPKDLTVLNTIGDLYARLGRGDLAAEYFRKVGDAYSSDGFVVKAIAIYKKLTKLNPTAVDSVVRLAELYTQQGLYNDARSQYSAVADQYLKNNDREQATGILRKMLDLDPENAAMQTKVADLYLKLGKNKEAIEIYFNSAQSLYQRASLPAAEEALAHVLKLDPNYSPALLLRGQIAAESGNSAAAVESFSKLPDASSRPEVVRQLLQAYLQNGDFEKADPLIAKVLAEQNDPSTVTMYANALLDAGKAEQAVSVYERYAEKFLPANGQALIDALSASVSKTKECAPALQSTLALLQRAGAAGRSLCEVQELLAHALVQAGQLQQAADLYQELSRAEPENPLHEQNYRQIIARMGKDAVTRELSTEEGEQALMVDALIVDELEAPPAVVQEYSRDLTEEINSALTDSELFSSYNVPDKAIAPLEQALPKAPKDIRLRQRLASLYARVGRFADAANSCTALAEVHAAAGLADQATHFREMAAKYNEQAAGVAASAPVIDVNQAHSGARPHELLAPGELPKFQATSVQETHGKEIAAETPEQEPSVAEFDLSTVPDESLPDVETASSSGQAETDGISEWEDMLTVESPAAMEAHVKDGAGTHGHGEVQDITAEGTPDEIVEEARFYLSQGMVSEAQSAIARLETIAPRHPALEGLRASARKMPAAAKQGAALGTKPNAEVIPEIEHKPAVTIDLGISKDSKTAPAASAKEKESKTASKETKQRPAPEHAAVAAFADTEDLLGDLLTDEAEEKSGFDDLIPEVAAGEPASFTAPSIRNSPAAPAVAAPVPASANPLAGMVADLEDALGDIAPPVPSVGKSSPAQKPTATSPSRVRPQVAAQSAPASVSVSDAADPQQANSMLSDLLEEFKEGIDEPVTEEDDPETHYNLGVAFREMGLLDEAIGELQKVCRAVDNGSPFSQPIQAYTWLAQCLVDKGAPQAAIRWYERALRVGGISEDSRLAVYYDMANAFESAGNKKAALDNFMEVYGANIDYRDVADRIRSLRA